MTLIKKEQMLDALKSLEPGKDLILRMTEEQAANLSLCVGSRTALESLVGKFLLNKETDSVNKELADDVLQKYIAVASDSYAMIEQILFSSVGKEAYSYIKHPNSKIDMRYETLNKMIILSKHVCSHCK